MTTGFQIREALSLLGGDPDEIAQHLLDKGCLARYCRYQSKIPWFANCPLAVYLEQQFPGQKIGVKTSTTQVGRIRIRTPDAFYRFISKFDGGVYPFLYASEGESE